MAVEPHAAAGRSTEQRLLDAAIRLFARRGYDAIGIREIAAAADLTIGALYHYAESKEALLFRIMRDGLTEAVEVLQEAAAAADDPAERLIRLVEAHVHQQVADAERWIVVEAEMNALTEPSRTEIVRLRDDYERIWDDVLREGVESGRFLIEDRVLARLALVEMCNGVSDWYRPEGRLTVAEIAQGFGSLALALVRVQGPPPPQAA
jgi:AcrR family transcriptional regulator